jgi:uncharacterized membrane protein YhaH (DUF805 family)
MDWHWFLFSFEGRISRAKLFWAGLIILSWMIILGMLTLAVHHVFGGPKSFYFGAGVMIALSLWGFVEMLCLRGTRGPNRFGPDPLAAVKRSPRAAPNWDQLRELEFLRRGAGPSPGEHVKRGHD